MNIITIRAPLTVQVHLGNPKIARIAELDIRTLRECEGGGWYMPASQAEALVSAWNGYVNSAGDDAKGLPTWAQLTAYWKERAEKAEAELSALLRAKEASNAE